jgi:cystathionine gamma-synthase
MDRSDIALELGRSPCDANRNDQPPWDAITLPTMSESGPGADDNRYRPETLAVTSGRPPASAGQPLNVPLELASNFRAGTAAAPVNEYARDGGTASWHALEDAVGALEGGTALAFGSGMGAAAAMVELLPTGAHVVVPTDSYAGVRALLADGAAHGRWKVSTVDITDTAATKEAAWAADMLWLESPSNPMMDVADLPELCRFGRGTGALVVVDNTFATPLGQRPLSFGAQLVLHSATKFIGGHSDLLLGIAVTDDAELAARLATRRKLGGATPGALEAFLALRGLRTLPVRLARSQESAGILARRLREHEEVSLVRYPGLVEDPWHDRAAAQMTGFGAMLSFEVAGGAEAADLVCSTVRVVTSATSLGGVESTIERRAKLAGSEHVPPGLLRLSVGIEHVEDLWTDLDRALTAAAAGY